MKRNESYFQADFFDSIITVTRQLSLQRRPLSKTPPSHQHVQHEKEEIQNVQGRVRVYRKVFIYSFHTMAHGAAIDLHCDRVEWQSLSGNLLRVWTYWIYSYHSKRHRHNRLHYHFGYSLCLPKIHILVIGTFDSYYLICMSYFTEVCIESF